MQIYNGLEEISSGLYLGAERYAVTFGKFDGLHLGHQVLLNTFKEEAIKYHSRTLVISLLFSEHLETSKPQSLAQPLSQPLSGPLAGQQSLLGEHRNDQPRRAAYHLKHQAKKGTNDKESTGKENIDKESKSKESTNRGSTDGESTDKKNALWPSLWPLAEKNRAQIPILDQNVTVSKPYICSKLEREAMLREWGINCLLYLHFDVIKSLSYEAFLDLLLSTFNITVLVGSDKFSIGFQKQGTPKQICSYLETRAAKRKNRLLPPLPSSITGSKADPKIDSTLEDPQLASQRLKSAEPDQRRLDNQRLNPEKLDVSGLKDVEIEDVENMQRDFVTQTRFMASMSVIEAISSAMEYPRALRKFSQLETLEPLQALQKYSEFQPSHLVKNKNRDVGLENKHEMTPNIAKNPAKGSQNARRTEILSTTLIKKMLLAGDVASAMPLMWLPFSLSGKIVHGKGEGRLMGYPTANFFKDAHKIDLKEGTYITLVYFQSVLYRAVTFIGTPMGGTIEPTPSTPNHTHHSDSVDSVEASSINQANSSTNTPLKPPSNSLKYSPNSPERKNIPIIETFLLDFTDSMYNKDVIIYFLLFLRENIVPKDQQVLQKYIKKDQEQASAYFKTADHSPFLTQITRKIYNTHSPTHLNLQ